MRLENDRLGRAATAGLAHVYSSLLRPDGGHGRSDDQKPPTGVRWKWVLAGMIGLYIVTVALRAKSEPRWRSLVGPTVGDQVLHGLIVAVAGALVGAFFSQRLKRFRKLLGLLLVVVSAVGYLNAPEPTDFPGWFFVGAATAWLLLRVKRRPAPPPPYVKPTTFGSAEWADLVHMMERQLLGDTGHLLGWFYDGETRLPIHYTGTRHLLTIAPNGGGKGVAAIVPNLLRYCGSVLATDPKGELAAITAAQRRRLGQAVHILDPWGIVPGETSSRFNPLDFLDADDPDLGEKAMMLADAIVVKEGSGENMFWDEEAKSLLCGLIIFVVLEPLFVETRTLGAVRDLMNAPGEQFDKILQAMNQSPNAIVSSTAARTMAKTEKLRSIVLTTLQAHTHFLDSPRLRDNMSRSDFRFEDLKRSKMTVYLVLPADRLNAFNRWLRLAIQLAITATARDIETKPDRPVLFMLDEMAALGRLTMVEQAYGLMAGFGMQLWSIVQDTSQLERIYGTGWETFVSNSGVLQYFGSRDEKTAAYFSKLCGVTTIEKWSFTKGISRALGISGSSSGSGGSSSGWSHTTTDSSSVSADVIQRSLAYPDELMVMRRDQSLLLVENHNPISAGKITWYTDDRFRTLGVNLQGRVGPAGRPGVYETVAPVTYNRTGELAGV